MKLPRANLAVVNREKIMEYLLNREHPDNGGKAEFFIALGFNLDEWEILAESLRQLAVLSEVSRSMASPHGKKYIVDGQIETPIGKTPIVRTIWIVDTGESIARLVTAYPHED